MKNAYERCDLTKSTWFIIIYYIYGRNNSDNLGTVVLMVAIIDMNYHHILHLRSQQLCQFRHCGIDVGHYKYVIRCQQRFINVVFIVGCNSLIFRTKYLKGNTSPCKNTIYLLWSSEGIGIFHDWMGQWSAFNSASDHKRNHRPNIFSQHT